MNTENNSVDNMGYITADNSIGVAANNNSISTSMVHTRRLLWMTQGHFFLYMHHMLRILR